MKIRRRPLIQSIPEKPLSAIGQLRAQEITPADFEVAPALHRLSPSPIKQAVKGTSLSCMKAEGRQASVGLDCTQIYRPGEKLPVIPHLSPALAELQATVNSDFEARSAEYVKSFLGVAHEVAGPGAPPTFGPDDAKAVLLPERWLGEAFNEEVKAFRSSGANTVLHQAAHACAQLAMLEKMNELALLPADDPRRSVLVTAGGCGSGKGYALKQGLSRDFKKHFGAVWDSAGEQCSLDHHWILAEAAKRGLKVTVAFVHADPVVAFQRAVTKRYEEEGRLVNLRSFVESYVDGAMNARHLVEHLKDLPGEVSVVLVNNSSSSPAAKVFKQQDSAEALAQFDAWVPSPFSAAQAESLAEQLGALVPQTPLPPHAVDGLHLLNRSNWF